MLSCLYKGYKVRFFYHVYINVDIVAHSHKLKGEVLSCVNYDKGD